MKNLRRSRAAVILFRHFGNAWTLAEITETVLNLKTRAIIVLSFAISFGRCTLSQTNEATSKTRADSISRLEMHLSAFGVESDDFPSIDVYVDFLNDSSSCHKWYYNPKYKDSTYHLTATEIRKILSLLDTTDLNKIKTEYKNGPTDQPTSTTTIFVGHRQFMIHDYGLQADDPLKSLYQLVYKY